VFFLFDPRLWDVIKNEFNRLLLIYNQEVKICPHR